MKVTARTLRRLICSLVAAATLLAVAPASAHHVVVNDPDDTRGFLDVRKVDVLGLERPRWKIGTWGWWTARTIFDRGYLLVHLDSFGDSRYDYYVLVRSRGYDMAASLWRDFQNKPDKFKTELTVWRKSKRNVSVRVPLSLLYFPGANRVWTWEVETLFTSDRCRRVCMDRAPDEGRVREPQPIQS